MTIDGGETGGALHGVLELHIVDEKRDDLDAGVDESAHHDQKNDELEAAAAVLPTSQQRLPWPCPETTAGAPR